MFYGKLLADAKEERDAARNKLKLSEATTELQMREQAALEGKKLTEAALKSLVITDGKIQKRINKVTEKEKVINILEAVLRSLEHRKAGVDNLVDLFNKGYYSNRPLETGIDLASNDVRNNLNSKEKK